MSFLFLFPFVCFYFVECHKTLSTSTKVLNFVLDTHTQKQQNQSPNRGRKVSIKKWEEGVREGKKSLQVE